METENGKVIYVITVIGVGINTEVHLKWNEKEAVDFAMNLLEEFDIKEPEEMCYECWKGFSDKAQCDVEIEVHERPLNQ